MNTLDFGEVMEKDGWFEDYSEDLSCPFCGGEEKKAWDALTEKEQKEATVKYAREKMWAEYEEWCQNNGCWPDTGKCPDTPANWDKYCTAEVDPSCVEAWYAENKNDFDFECEECSGGMFEVMWNTAFAVDVHSNLDREEARRAAWSKGFCLVEHNGRAYLLMGMCGSDYTWVIHYTRWLLQDRFLELDDAENCLSNWGAHVFLSGNAKKEFLAYLEGRVLDVDRYLNNLSYRMEDALRVRSGPRAKQDAPERLFRVRVARVTYEVVDIAGKTPLEAYGKVLRGETKGARVTSLPQEHRYTLNVVEKDGGTPKISEGRE